MIMSTRAIQYTQVEVGGFIQAYTRHLYQKRTSWSNSQTVIKYLPFSHTEVVGGSE